MFSSLVYQFFLADIANIEQASLCLRYVYNGIIQEKFIKFIPVNDRSGAGLANLLLKELANLGMITVQIIFIIELNFYFFITGLNLEFCVDQGYDGCSTMSGTVLMCLSTINQSIVS